MYLEKALKLYQKGKFEKNQPSMPREVLKNQPK